MDSLICLSSSGPSHNDNLVSGCSLPPVVEEASRQEEREQEAEAHSHEETTGWPAGVSLRPQQSAKKQAQIHNNVKRPNSADAPRTCQVRHWNS